MRQFFSDESCSSLRFGLGFSVRKCSEVPRSEDHLFVFPCVSTAGGVTSPTAVSWLGINGTSNVGDSVSSLLLHMGVSSAILNMTAVTWENTEILYCPRVRERERDKRAAFILKTPTCRVRTTTLNRALKTSEYRKVAHRDLCRSLFMAGGSLHVGDPALSV